MIYVFPVRYLLKYILFIDVWMSMILSHLAEIQGCEVKATRRERSKHRVPGVTEHLGPNARRVTEPTRMDR